MTQDKFDKAMEEISATLMRNLPPGPWDADTSKAIILLMRDYATLLRRVA